MPKILYVTPGCFDKGGISRYNRYQISCLRELYGEENVRVLSFLGPDENPLEGTFEVFWHGTIHSTKAKINFVRKIISTIISWKPQLVLAAHVNYSGLLVMLSKIFNFKTVLNIYGIEIWSGMSQSAAYGLKNSDFIISDCHNTADYVRNKKLSAAEMVVIWDCVDIEKFKFNPEGFEALSKKYNLPDREKYFILLTLGRISKDAEYKGYSRLLDVFYKVLNRGRHAKLIYAGSGNLISTLQQKAQVLGIEKHIIFTGSVDEKEMASMYSYGHLFSMVTESGIGMGEGIPLTPLEAMACRTPIIVGNEDGSREAVFNNENGYVISPQDLETHADIIITLIDHPEEQNKLGMGAEKIAQHYFGYTLFKEKHSIALNKMIA